MHLFWSIIFKVSYISIVVSFRTRSEIVASPDLGLLIHDTCYSLLLLLLCFVFFVCIVLYLFVVNFTLDCSCLMLKNNNRNSARPGLDELLLKFQRYFFKLLINLAAWSVLFFKISKWFFHLSWLSICTTRNLKVLMIRILSLYFKRWLGIRLASALIILKLFVNHWIRHEK